ncbi:hypothetical protein TNIN_228151 [Trichonephila inaurata madagascariensis]|uniref:Uncharacterized protein n=1 Tax=Trichonephila inaurata madagascariensis TaxID=2747483 RepID=A0A8X6IGF0_9ARAC|nr:hypothetical protein TNIN_228151 [Trichonephila inaurata madagascariensis]
MLVSYKRTVGPKRTHHFPRKPQVLHLRSPSGFHPPPCPPVVALFRGPQFHKSSSTIQELSRPYEFGHEFGDGRDDPTSKRGRRRSDWGGLRVQGSSGVYRNGDTGWGRIKAVIHSNETPGNRTLLFGDAVSSNSHPAVVAQGPRAGLPKLTF